jgi:chromosome transmission fidelity protein 1
LVFEAKIDTINIFSLLAFIEKSELTKKLRGFAERYQGEDIATNDGAIDAEGHGSRTHSSLQSIADLLASLTNDDQDGRILLTRCFKGGKVHASSSVGFVMMNPCVNFKEIVEEARSVVLLGGTMRPFSHFVDQLFLHLPAEKVKVMACPHVVPPENVLAVSLSAGPTGTKLSLTYQHRGESGVITELGRVLLNVCSVVPEGVVCFFPSYAYMNQVVDHWKGSGLLAQLQRKKPLLSEPRSAAPHRCAHHTRRTHLHSATSGFLHL